MIFFFPPFIDQLLDLYFPPAAAGFGAVFWELLLEQQLFSTAWPWVAELALGLPSVALWQQMLHLQGVNGFILVPGPR